MIYALHIPTGRVRELNYTTSFRLGHNYWCFYSTLGIKEVRLVIDVKHLIDKKKWGKWSVIDWNDVEVQTIHIGLEGSKVLQKAITYQTQRVLSGEPFKLYMGDD